MALSRRQSVHTYASSSGGLEYLFDVLVDGQGLVSVRNVRSPFGIIADPHTGVPRSVVADMNDAQGVVLLATAESEVDSGQVSFVGGTEMAVALPAGVLNTANYRVVLTPSDPIRFVAINKTAAGFTIEAPVAYGSVAVPKVVGYSVVAATASHSSLSGVLTLAAADTGHKRVTFSTALASDRYRVVLLPQGPFLAWVVSQTKTGFLVKIGHTVSAGTTVDVNFDVFV